MRDNPQTITASLSLARRDLSIRRGTVNLPDETSAKRLHLIL